MNSNPQEKDKFKDNPYNDNNKFITETNIKDIFSKIGFSLKINNMELYQTAFVHKLSLIHI